LTDDNGPAEGNGNATFFIDDIRFLDGAGNVIMGDTSVAFNPPDGFGGGGTLMVQWDLEQSGVASANYEPFIQINTTNAGGEFDIAWLVNGFAITVEYEGEMTPECVFQSWTGGPDWKKVAAISDEDGKAVFDLAGAIAAYGDDFSQLDAIRVGSAEGALEVFSVTARIPSPGIFIDTGQSGVAGANYDPFIQINTVNNDDGLLDPAWLVNGFAVTVEYEGEMTPECIFQSWSGGPDWKKVTAVSDDGSKAVFDLAGVLAAYGDDFSQLEAIRVGSAEGALEVFSVVLTIPGADLGQAGVASANYDPFIQVNTVKNGGPFDPEWLVKGFVIVVKYEGEMTPECIMQSWSGGPDWKKVTAISDDGSTAVFDLAGIIAAYGDDYSALDALRVGSAEGDLEVFSVWVQIN
jgi:hypothetical protein